ncbi:MAG: response regulator transcription factor [Acidimicrobiia bacterium]|nr:response regulator transcription factor [Acidimicrobiia bacterium]
MHLLLVEDDDAIAEPLERGLEREGIAVTRVATGAGALAAAAGPGAATFDLVLLDLGLPDVDGLEVCRGIRAASGVPIIVVTARADEVDRVVGLELGADDYLTKPFGFRELLARVRAVLRRTAPVGRHGTPAPVALQAGSMTVDLRTREVTVGGRKVALTPKEFDLVAFLAEDPGRVFSRGEILEAVWDPHWYGPTRTLDAHVASLRRKLGAHRIETVRGVGFRLAGEDPA